MSSISSAANHPNAREYNRKTRKLLRDICSHHLSADGTPGWGYIIYRTTYTPESTTLFPRVLTLLNNYIRAGIDRELHECKRNNMDNPDPLPNDEVWRLHRPTVLDDKAEFDGLSPDGVRAHFESWVDRLGFNAYPEPYHEPWMDEEGPLRPSWPRCRAFIVIDDEVLQLLADVPSEAEYAVKKSEYGYRGRGCGMSRWLRHGGMSWMPHKGIQVG